MARTRRILRLNDVLSEFCMPLRPRAAHPRPYGRLYVICIIRSPVSLFRIARDHVKKRPREFARSFFLFLQILFALLSQQFFFFFFQQCIFATKKTSVSLFGLFFHRFRRFDDTHRIYYTNCSETLKIKKNISFLQKTFLNCMRRKKILSRTQKLVFPKFTFDQVLLLRDVLL